MTKFYLAWSKDDPVHADVVQTDDPAELLDPKVGGYHTWDGPFDEHTAYVESQRNGKHDREAVPGCEQCEDKVVEKMERRMYPDA